MNEASHFKPGSSWSNKILKFFYPCWVFFASKKKVDRLNEESIWKAQNGNGEITIILHGILTNYHTAVYWAIRWFRRAGVNIVSLGFDYEADLNTSANQIKEQVDKILERGRITKVNMVGISLGGGVARYYIEKCGGKDVVKRLVTVFAALNSPKDGEFSMALSLEKIFGTKETTAITIEQARTINTSFSVEQLAIYGTSDWIIGKNSIPVAPFPNVTLLPMSGGHLFVSYNVDAMEVALHYILYGKAGIEGLQ